MGEYAKFNGKEIKIGTCEDMYYLRYEQRFLVTPLPNSLNPRDKEILKLIRFRFPWPDEDNHLPGSYPDPFRTFPIDGVKSPEGVEHYSVQFRADNGYLCSLPCPEGSKTIPGLTIHKNGYGGAVHLYQQAVRNGKLVPVFQCGGCETAWRIEDEEELKPYVEALQHRIKRDGGSYFQQILDRMMIRPAQPKRALTGA